MKFMNSLIEGNKKDIYFDNNYGKLYEKVENGKAEVFLFTSEYGTVKNQFIKREVPRKIDGKTFYDIVTPYGYGGPIVIANDDQKREELVLQYMKSFSQYCKENNIVSEFIRFHPMINNAHDFKDVYTISCDRKTIGTNLIDFDNPIQSEFSKSCRKNIQKALNKGVNFEVVENPTDISEFKKIYYSTMDRNNATEYYYFDDEYFDLLITFFKNNILVVKAMHEDITIAQGLYFVYGKNIHIHLSGTLSEYLYLSPAYVLRYAVTLWGKENGYEMIHHGGGRSSKSDDSLYLFKKQFGKNTEFNFYTGKKIWNNEIYSDLTRILNVTKNTEYFPAYRSK